MGVGLIPSLGTHVSGGTAKKKKKKNTWKHPNKRTNPGLLECHMLHPPLHPFSTPNIMTTD